MVAQDVLAGVDRLAGGIPKLLHRVWLGAEVPDDVTSFGRMWQRLHPTWRVMLWRDWTLPALDNQAAFDQSPHASQRSNIVRFEVLRRWGGVYVDTDVEPLKPLDELLAEVECSVGREDDRWIGTAFMAACPAHPFICHLSSEVGPSVLRAPPGTPSNVVSGPKFVTTALARWVAGGGEPVTVFPPALFYPYHFSEAHRRGEEFPDAYAIHHWAASWVSAAGSDRTG